MQLGQYFFVLKHDMARFVIARGDARHHLRVVGHVRIAQVKRRAGILVFAGEIAFRAKTRVLTSTTRR